MNKSKKIFILTITFLMLVGLTTIAATDIDNNDTTTITQTSQATIDTTQTKTINEDTTNTKEVLTSQTDNIQESTVSQETLNNKNGEKTQNLKADRTETATNFEDLNSYLTSNSYDSVTIDIGDNIQLTRSITVNNEIKTLTINGNGYTINGQNNYQFLILPANTTATIKNITITQCITTIINRGKLTQTDSTFINNVGGNGGAIYNEGDVTLINNTFTNNSAGTGGAIINSGKLIVTNTTFSYNNVGSGAGGAIYNNGNVTLTNSTFINNTATWGGAIANAGNITLINNTFTNSIPAYTGGAINNEGNITLINNTFAYNNASGAGAISNAGNIILINNTFTNNTASFNGGAISNGGNVTLINNTFTNHYAYRGGAIYNEGNVTLINNTITNNSAGTGGAICSGGVVNLTNNTLTYNTATVHGGDRATGYGGAISSVGTLTLINNTLTYNSAERSGVIHTRNNLTITDSKLIDNYVINKNGYVVDFSNTDSVIITDNIFINNTNNVRDMLFSDASTDAQADIRDNRYIDNFLEVTIAEPDVTIVTDNEDRSYDYYIDLSLREIYNDTVRNGTLNVYVNDDLKDSANVTNGRTKIFFKNSDLTKRENIIILEYISPSKHYQNTTKTFTIKKEINTILIIEAPSHMTAGNNGIIKFILKDVNNNILSGETINVRINGQHFDMAHDNVVAIGDELVWIEATHHKGSDSIDFTAFGNGLLIIEATHHTNRDSFYLSAGMVRTGIEVNKIEPEIVIEHDTVVPYVETNITIHLFDSDGKPIQNKTLTVNITEEGKPDITGTVTTDENGIGVFNFTPVDEGILTVNVTCHSNPIYHYASEKVQISRNFITTNLVVTANSMKINQTNTITIKVLADDAALLSGTVELDIDGEIHTMNITNGRGTYHNYKSSTAGEKLVNAKFTSDNPSYTNATTTEEFNVEKLPTHVTINAVEGVVLDNVTFTVNVRDYHGNPVTGGYVQFNVGGKTLKDENGKNIRVLVENGIAKLSYQAESGWLVDSHPDLKVQAVFTGTSIARENRSDTNKVTIYKRNATVQVSAPDDYVNGTLHIDAIVKDQNGSLINDGVLVFKLNGLSVKDENNKGIVAKVVNGKVHLDVKIPFAYSAKKYNLTAIYSNKIYNKATGTNTTTLKAIPTYVNATVTIKDQFSKPVITGQIYNKFNNAILEGTAIINIKFDGISYAKKVKINNGTFTETLEGIPIYKPGTHKVEITAGANSHYDAVRKTITTKTTPKYNVNTEFINITRNKTTTRVQAKIVDDKNKNVQKNLRITIKLNGLSFLVNKTVTNGKVDVEIDTSTLKNRNYTLELVSGANTYYNAGKATIELQKY